MYPTSRKSYLSIFLVLLFSISCSGNSTHASDEDDTTKDPTPTPSKVLVSTYAAVTAPDGITLDKDGNIFAANYGTSKVYKVDQNKVVSLFMDNQPGAAGMAFDDNDIMLLARYNAGDVVRVSAEGSVIDTVARSIQGPIAVDFDAVGRLYVNNNVGLFVSRVDTSGAQSAYATHGIYNNSSLTLDEQDNVYVSHYGSGRIIKIDANDQSISEIVNVPIAGGLAFVIYSKGFFYATAIHEDVIYRISMDGNAEVIAGSGQKGYKDGTGDVAQFNSPNGIVASEDGKTLYVAEGGYIRVITNFIDE